MLVGLISNDSAKNIQDNDHPRIVIFSTQGDLILVSSDGVHFRVHSVILNDASRVFDTGFLDQQPEPRDSTSRTIQLDDDSVALDLLLS